MRCPGCNHETDPGARFCEACGAPIVRACAACGAAVKVTARFCPACGASLEAPQMSRQISADCDVPAEPQGERRQLTILFCDLVGSTALAAELDPEEWRYVIAQYQKAATEVVERGGGHVARLLGDGLLVYFGWPTAREDDAERAVRIGLGLLDAVAALACRLPMQLAVRIGMDTGPVVVGNDGEVYGEVPNVAARVQAAAEPNTVLITSVTHRLVAGLFVVEDRGPQQLKGMPKPVRLLRIVRPSGVRGRLAAAAERGLTPFIDREHERQLLRERFEQAREGQGQVLQLIGEPGIGKSRLAQALRADLVDTPHTWLECGGAPYSANTPFYALTQLLRHFLTAAGEISPAELVAGLERALESVDLPVAQALPLIAPLLDLPVPEGYPPVIGVPDAARKHLLAILAAWTLASARMQPLVILLEDLQWVDPSTLELQHLLVEQGATVPLLLLYTARPEFQPPWPLRAHHTQLTLSRLRHQYVRAMVGQVAARVALPPAVVDAVVTRTDGVPLFVEELTRAAVEAGAQAGEVIPATLQDSLMARLDRLGRTTKEVAQVGAVLGRDFEYGLLNAVHPVPQADLQGALERLVDAELLYVRGLVPAASYTFRHALVRDTAYGSLLKARRRALHERVARALTDRFPELARAQPEVWAQSWTETGTTKALTVRVGTDELAAEIAHHWFAAGPGGDAGQAVAWAWHAGDRARARFAYEEASRLYETALSALSWGAVPDPVREAELLLRLGDALKRAGEVEKAKAVFTRAAELGRELHSPELLTQAAIGFSPDLCVADRFDPDPPLISLLEEAIQAWRQRDSSLHAQALAHLATALFFGNDDLREQLVAYAVGMARRVCDPAALRYVLARRLLASKLLDELDERIAVATELVDSAERAADLQELAHGLLQRAAVLIEHGDMAGADRDIRALSNLADDLRQPFWSWYSTVLSAMRMTLDGRLEEAEQQAASTHNR
jgi:class 3 adenylate cyclase/tetratricopeptide (TPR) repeat protein